MFDKIEAIRLWLEAHHPALIIHPKGYQAQGYVMIEDPQRRFISIEIDFYDDKDSFYIYPHSTRLKGVRPLFEAHISDPTYFNKIDEMLHVARTIDPTNSVWNGRHLWEE